MPEISFAPGDLTFYLFILFIIAFLVQQVFYWVFFSRIAFYRHPHVKNVSTGISVVICARNEYENLKKNLPLILGQDHPDFEVVVVNWSSDDESSILLEQLSRQYSQLKIVEIRENLNFFSGKKFPLSIGIKSAGKDIIVVTEAGCKPVSNHWLSLMGSRFTGSAEIVLGYGAFEKKKGFLNKLIRYDTFHTACRYLSASLAGIPFMGVGRNLAYLRSLFIDNKGFISHYRVRPGEDDLFINKVAKKNNTDVLMNPEGFTVSEQKLTYREWMIRKRNQAFTGRLYRTGHRFLSTLYSLSIFLFYLLFAVLLIMEYNAMILVLPVFLVKLITQIFVFHRCMVKLNEKDLIWLVPFYDLSMMVIDSFASASSFLSRSNRWK